MQGDGGFVPAIIGIAFGCEIVAENAAVDADLDDHGVAQFIEDKEGRPLNYNF